VKKYASKPSEQSATYHLTHGVRTLHAFLRLEKNDDRKNGKYHVQVELVVYVDRGQPSLGPVFDLLNGQLQTCGSAVTSLPQFKLGDTWNSGERQFFKTRVSAAKPSLLPALDTLCKELAEAGLPDAALTAAAQACDRLDESKAREERLQDARRVAVAIARQADKAARDRVCYDSRLAALAEELRVQQQVELAKITLEELQKENMTDGDRYDERSISAGHAHAAEALPSTMPGLFHVSAEQKLTIEGQEVA
jgi:hypothetical protein